MSPWVRQVRDKSLGLCCLALVLAFHAINLRHGQLLAPITAWRARLGTVTLSLSAKDRDLFSFRFIGLPEPKPEASDAPPKPKPKPEPQIDKSAEKPESKDSVAKAAAKRAEPPRPVLDPASQWVAWLGLHLRAQVNQTQQRWINYRYAGRRYYYLRDEIAFQYEAEAPAVEKAFNEVTRLMDKVVSEAGGTLVITPMPTKVSINRDRLPAWLPEQTLWTPIEPYDHKNVAREVYRHALSGAPKSTVDVFRYFDRFHRENPKADLYVPSNHEWSSLGIALTSIGVVDNLRERGWKLDEARWSKLTEPGERFDENMLALLNLPPSFSWMYPQTKRREPLYGINTVATRRSKGRLIVFGTCFSNRMRDSNGFANTLARSLKRRKVINLAHEGGKSLYSIKAFAKRHKRFRKGDLVIWEFNVRETFTSGEVATIKRILRKMSRR